MSWFRRAFTRAWTHYDNYTHSHPLTVKSFTMAALYGLGKLATFQLLRAVSCVATGRCVSIARFRMHPHGGGTDVLHVVRIVVRLVSWRPLRVR